MRHHPVFFQTGRSPERQCAQPFSDRDKISGLDWIMASILSPTICCQHIYPDPASQPPSMRQDINNNYMSALRTDYISVPIRQDQKDLGYEKVPFHPLPIPTGQVWNLSR